MKKSRKFSASSASALPNGALALLNQLSMQGSFAVVDPLNDEALCLYVTQDGISLSRGSMPLSIAKILVTRDLVEWSRSQSGRRRLSLSSVGLAFLARVKATRDDRSEDGFLVQHRLIDERVIRDEHGPQRVKVNSLESPLEWLRRRSGGQVSAFIDQAEFEAGERLRRDLTFAAMLPRVTADWSKPMGADGLGTGDQALASDMVVAARQRVTRAMQDVGPDFSGLLIDVCGFLKRLDQIERERGWPIRSGKVVLKLALSRLAQHYGLNAQAKGVPSRRKAHVWRPFAWSGCLEQPGIAADAIDHRANAI